MKFILKLVLSVGFLVTSAVADPAVFFTDVESGPVEGGPNGFGVPISIFGKGFGSSRGSSKVTIGGVEVAAYNEWGVNNSKNAFVDMITVQPGRSVVGGAIVVTVNGKSSNSNFSFQKNSGKILYIAPNGTDNPACSVSSPCRNVLHAIQPPRSAPGDTILVRGGEYSEGEIWIRDTNGAGGSAGQQKTVRNYPGEEPLFSNASRNMTPDASYLTFSGLRFANGKGLGMYDVPNTAAFKNNIKFINNKFAGTIGYDAIGTHGNNHVIAGNFCEASGSSQGTQGHCYYISAGDNLKLLYNVGAGIPGYGIHIFDQRRSANDFKRVISNVLVEGNILRNSIERSGLIVAMGDESGLGNIADGITIRNNLFVANNHHGVSIGTLTRNIKIYNNTFYQNGRQELILGGENTANVEVRNNLFYHTPNANCVAGWNCSWYQDAHVQYGQTGISGLILNNNGYFGQALTILTGVGSNQNNVGAAGDPAAVTGSVSFANPAALDFRVASGGASINRGVNLGSAVARDYFGVVRPQGPAYDLGAVEFDVGTVTPNDTMPPAAPGALRIVQ